MNYILQEEINNGNYRCMKSSNNNKELFFECLVCEVPMSGTLSGISHANGKQHLKNVRMKRLGVTPVCNSIERSFNQLCITDPMERVTHPFFNSPSSSCGSSSDECLDRSSSIYLTDMSTSLDEILKENFLSRKEDQSIKCDACNITLTGEVPALQHAQGKSHKKKLALNRSLTNISNSYFQSSTPIRRSSINSGTDTDEKLFEEAIALKEVRVHGDSFHCLVCDVQINSQISCLAHLKGAPHDKERNRRSLTNISNSYLQSSTPIRRSPNNSGTDTDEKLFEEAIALNEVRAHGDSFHCLVCDVQINSQISCLAHLKGAPHDKERNKRSQTNSSNSYLQTLTPIRSPVNGGADTDEKFLEEAITQKEIRVEGDSYHCLVCDLPLNSKIPCLAHLKGAPHDKKRRNKRIMSSIMAAGGSNSNHTQAPIAAPRRSKMAAQVAEDSKNLDNVIIINACEILMDQDCFKVK